MDADFAEAEEHAAAGLRTTEAGLRPEVGEHHHLVNLAQHGLITGASQDSVGDNLALRVQSSFKQQRS